MKNTTYKLADSLFADIKRMHEEVKMYKNGEKSAAQFRSFRVPQGVYEERTEGSFMLRVRIPAGAVFPQQARVLADVSRTCGNGVLHVTTRQDIQVHSVDIDSIADALQTLADAGLSTLGGGGNGIRNITTCEDSGTCKDELFDVRPFATALTERLINDSDNFSLPRKYKIAFAGCPADCGGAIVNDLGFIAKIKEGKSGFSVYAGGGMGAKSAAGQLLEQFIPVQDCFRVADAVKRVFDSHGNRRNKNKARLRFLIQQIGFDRFRKLYSDELNKLKSDPGTRLNKKDRSTLKGVTLKQERGTGKMTAEKDMYNTWAKHNILQQKQNNLYSVSLPLELGDISAQSFSGLADVAEQYGDGMIHTTQRQNLRLHSVKKADLTELYRELQRQGLASALPGIIQNTTVCTGAQTCKLGICLSRGMAKAIINSFSDTGSLSEGMRDLKVSISGCPNSCGRHPIAQIGLFGGARRVEGRLTPHYTVQIGGRLGEGRTSLAKTVDILHARNVPGFILEFLKAYKSSEHFPQYDAFLEDGGRDIAAEIALRHKTVPSFKEDKNYYYDYGGEKPFSLAGRGPGECGAGVFDLIEIDIRSAGEALSEGRLIQSAALAARALLVTRGEEAHDDINALKLFKKHFLDTGLVKGEAKRTAELALKTYRNKKTHQNLDSRAVKTLISQIQHLYDNMDQSLKFPESTDTGASELSAQSKDRGEEGIEYPDSAIEPDKEADFREVSCPLNYVKTKMALSPMKPGEVLAVLVDEEGCKNVPDSVKNDGHQVLGITRDGKHYRINIRKK